MKLEYSAKKSASLNFFTQLFHYFPCCIYKWTIIVKIIFHPLTSKKVASFVKHSQSNVACHYSNAIFNIKNLFDVAFHGDSFKWMSAPPLWLYHSCLLSIKIFFMLINEQQQSSLLGWKFIMIQPKAFISLVRRNCSLSPKKIHPVPGMLCLLCVWETSHRCSQHVGTCMPYNQGNRMSQTMYFMLKSSHWNLCVLSWIDTRRCVWFLWFS